MTVKSDATATRSIFAAAIKLTDESARQAFVELACREDEILRADVQALLEADAGSSPLDEVAAQLGGDPHAADPATTDTFITNSPDEGAFDAAPPLDVAKQPQIGPYKIREQIGEGGMGYVYVAEQTEPVRRKVALKVIKPGMDTKEVVARFEAERQALAMMSHPNIAKVLDGGATEQGRPYFVMELVNGVSITQFCDRQKLGTRERLELFVTVCDAVQHAHMKGIIHRDLKPSNVIVELHDVKPFPKVIDFGVAKATGQQLSSHTIYTQFAQLVGTPLYMSPEQAQQSALDVDTRSDIYSLGVLLYELLTGTTPFDKSTLSSVDATELRRIICEDDPPRPSARVSTLKNEQLTTIATSHKTEPRQLALSLQRELDWIVMKALEKDRTRRYDSASALAADIQRYLHDEPVEACPPSVGYRLRKYASRHRGTVVTASLIAVTLLVGAGLATWQAVRASAAEEQAEQNYAAAIEALEKLLVHVGHPELAEIPRAQNIRREILEDSLEFFEQATAQAGAAPAVKFRAANVYLLLGNLAKTTYSNDDAAAAFEKSITLADELVVHAPDRQDYRELQASAYRIAGGFYVEPVVATDAFDRAIEYLEKAELLWERLTLIEPGNLEYRATLALVLRKQADAYWKHGFQDDPRVAVLARRAYDLSQRSIPKPGASHLMARVTESTDPEQSDAYYREAVKLLEEDKSDSLSSQFGRGWLKHMAANHLKQRHPDEAEELYQESIDHLSEMCRDFPSNTRAAQQLAATVRDYVSLLQTREPQEARACIDNLAQKFPDVPHVHQMRAVFQSQMPNAEQLLEASIEQYPQHWAYYDRRGRIHHARGELEQAMADLDRAVALFNGNNGGVLHTRPFMARALLLEEMGEYSRAADDLSQCIDKNQMPIHYALRARAWFRAEKFDKAISDLRSALEISPRSRNPVTQIPTSEIAACRDRGFRRAFLEVVDEFVENNEESSKSLLERATILAALGRQQDARADLRQIGGQEPADYYTCYRAALLTLTLTEDGVYRSLCQQMVTEFADSENPTDTHFATWTCALAPNALADYEPAIKLARQALETEPTSQQYINGLGAILLRAGRYDEAKAQLEQALAGGESEKTSTSYIRYFLAMTEHHLGNTEAAQEQLAAANSAAEKELSGNPAWNRKLTLELLRKEAETLITAGQEADNEQSPRRDRDNNNDESNPDR